MPTERWFLVALWASGCMGSEVVLKPTTPVGTTSTVPTDTTPVATTTDTTNTTPIVLGPCQALYQHDDDIDGTIERSGLATYDPADPSHLLVFLLDVDNDGVDDLQDTTTYDASGNKLRWESLNLRTGVTDGIYEWEYDSDNRMIAFRTDYWFFADGVWDTNEAYTYDDAGFLASVTGFGTTGTFFHTTFTNDPVTGDVLLAEHDTGANGTIDKVVTYTYDAVGRIARVGADTNADGIEDNGVQWWVYDDPVLKVGTEFHDNDADGVHDYRAAFVYDPALDLQTYWGINNGGGTRWELEQTVVWDPVLREPLSIDYVNAMQRPHQTWRSEFAYDGYGRMVSHHYTSDVPAKTYLETWTMSACP